MLNLYNELWLQYALFNFRKTFYLLMPNTKWYIYGRKQLNCTANIKITDNTLYKLQIVKKCGKAPVLLFNLDSEQSQSCVRRLPSTIRQDGGAYITRVSHPLLLYLNWIYVIHSLYWKKLAVYIKHLNTTPKTVYHLAVRQVD